ncbi:hypothetical protein GGP86_003079 [Salinibacter ruber]|uniref:toxin-antitoxin system TumE family protein n=1 Tax=Salinibacter ruber TaxID=146919 RepID=UPI002168D5FD|nr:DUF6516 family protein [Salinibacter ruber]MCS3863283.1 hypothetical protein [Salinibacter ruber]
MKLLDASSVVADYEVLDFKTFGDGWYYKIEVEFEDRSVLHAREYADAEERNYSFHWQDESNQLRIRWDNAPNHGHISTHPHHKHVGDDVRPSDEIAFAEVFEHIEEHLRGGSNG